MFETNKLPTEQRTVTGNPVSFNTHYALPLDACKVSFSATQAGSGDPSPSNPRAISGVSAIGLTANSTPVSVSLGEERYGGELDVLTGVLTLDKTYIKINGTTDYKFNGVFGATSYGYVVYSSFSRYMRTNAICDKFKYSTNGYTTMPLYSFGGSSGSNFTFSFVLPSTITSLREANTWLVDNPITIVATIEIPITIQLSPTDLSSIIGNNTFSTDTGTLEITFADLQEKSASGAVTTFNTALAMPLASCNIAINAWQEGSGDPSPVNDRPIHGYDSVDIGRCNSKFAQLWNIDTNFNGDVTFNQKVKSPLEGGTFGRQYAGGISYDGDTAINTSTSNDQIDIRNSSPLVSFIKTHKYFCGADIMLPSNNAIKLYFKFSLKKITSTLTPNVWNGVYTVTSWLTDNENTYMDVVTASSVSVGDTLKVKNFMVIDLTEMFGSTIADYIYNLEQTTEGAGVAFFKSLYPNDYYSYDVGTQQSVGDILATIQLGQEVYGAEVDVVNGVATVKWGKKTIADLSFIAQSGNRFTATISDCVNTPNFTGFLCSTYKPILVNANNNTWLSNRVITIVDNRFTTATEFKEAMGDTQIVYPIATPFDIQLTPTQIETLIGNNTIFADTGDVDLTYKDCDLAKRGDFRQVFKIPD